MAVPTFPTGSAIVSADLRWPITTKPLTMAYPSASQAYVTNTVTPLNLNTEIIDRSNMHSGSSSQIFIGLEPGWYRVSGYICWSNMTGGTWCIGYVAKNGTSVSAPINLEATAGGFPTITVEAYVHSDVAADYVELVAYHFNGSTINTLGSGQGGMLCVEFMGT